MKKLSLILEKDGYYAAKNDSPYATNPIKWKDSHSSKLRGHLEKWAAKHEEGFAPGTHQAVEDYKVTGYSPVNKKLRHGDASHKWYGMSDKAREQREEQAKRLIPHLDHATGNRTERGFHVYRGIDDRGIKDLQPGDTIHDKGYTSTSLHPAVADGHASTGHILKIYVPRGTKGHYLDGYTPHRMNNYSGENEFLLHRGTTFRVTHHTEDKIAGIKTIHMHVVHQGKPVKTSRQTPHGIGRTDDEDER